MIIYNKDARERLKAGAKALADAVKVTMGPYGSNVVINTATGPYVTKDGVTVAKYVFLEDRFENMGAQMVKEASSNTNSKVGDGTTTATVLTNAILEKGTEADIPQIKEDLEEIIQELNFYKQDVTESDIKNVAMVSTNNDEELSDLIYKSYKEVGTDIIFEESRNNKTYYEVTKGLKLENASYLSTYFINRSDNIARYDDVDIFLYDGKFENVKQVFNVLKQATRPLIIFCDDIDNNCIMTMMKNNKEGSKSSIAIRTPGFGYGRVSALQDIAAYTGGNIYSRKIPPRDVKFGYASYVEANRHSTAVIGGGGKQEDIDRRIKSLEFSNDSHDPRIQKRISQLKRGLATIYVGAESEVEMKEKRDRLEDGINAVKASVKEGIIKGAGIPLYEIGETRDTVLYKAIREPYKQILENGNKEYIVVDEDIVDPLLVTKTALRNAVSVATTILSTNTAISYEVEGHI